MNNMNLLDKVFHCELCPKAFSRKYSLTRHMIEHDGEQAFGMYECKVCCKTFSQKRYLDSHMNVHCEEKPYHCTICNSTYALKSSLSRHMKKAHSKDESSKKSYSVESLLNLNPYIMDSPPIIKDSILDDITLDREVIQEIPLNPPPLQMQQDIIVSKEEMLFEYPLVHKSHITEIPLTSSPISKTQNDEHTHSIKDSQPIKDDTPLISKDTPLIITPFSCDTCNKMFTSEKHRQEHFNSHEMCATFAANDYLTMVFMNNLTGGPVVHVNNAVVDTSYDFSQI